jgi:glycosyltransferase involved in cell wall biosynthesis
LPEVAAYGAGIEVQPSVEPLATALRELLTDAETRSKMGQSARQVVRERFTWDSVAERLEVAYTRLLER